MKNQIIADDELFAKVSSVFVEALRVDPQRIELNSKLFLDLGAESIDILDIRFKLEETFGFKINQDELINSLGQGLNAEEIQEKFTVQRLMDYIKKQMQGNES